MSKSIRRPTNVSPPAFIPPCLATLAAAPPEGDQWVHEIKFDGYRLQARIDSGTVQLLTRSGIDWTEKFQPVKLALLKLKLSSAIIDGELIIEDADGAPNFADLVDDLKARRTSRMVFVAFDLLFLNGADERGLPLADRKDLLAGLFHRRNSLGQLRYSDHLVGDGAAMLAQACKRGLEGIVSKRIDKPYMSGRGTVWVKSKCILSDEFVIGGYLGSAVSENAVGALAVGFFDGNKFIYAGRVGTGFSRRLAGEIWHDLQRLKLNRVAFSTQLTAAQSKDVVWVKPEKVVQVDYRAWTAGGILRHASFKSLRNDKPSREVNDPRAG